MKYLIQLEAFIAIKLAICSQRTSHVNSELSPKLTWLDK